MPGSPSRGSSEARLRLPGDALWLVSVSVAFGVLSGTVSVITGLQDHSLGVFAVGLGVLADVLGSAVLIWRFRAERRPPGHSGRQEARAAVVVAIALGVVAVVLAIQSAAALASGSHPGTSGVTLIAAGVSLAVLTPLAWAKRRLGRRMASRALQGDGTLSGIGAATSLLALTARSVRRAGLVSGRPDRGPDGHSHRRRRSMAHRAAPTLTLPAGRLASPARKRARACWPGKTLTDSANHCVSRARGRAGDRR